MIKVGILITESCNGFSCVLPDDHRYGSRLERYVMEYYRGNGYNVIRTSVSLSNPNMKEIFRHNTNICKVLNEYLHSKYGMPDLFIWKNEHDYKFVEVKSFSDGIKLHQILWSIKYNIDVEYMFVVSEFNCRRVYHLLHETNTDIPIKIYKFEKVPCHFEKYIRNPNDDNNIWTIKQEYNTLYKEYKKLYEEQETYRKRIRKEYGTGKEHIREEYEIYKKYIREKRETYKEDVREEFRVQIEKSIEEGRTQIESVCRRLNIPI